MGEGSGRCVAAGDTTAWIKVMVKVGGWGLRE